MRVILRPATILLCTQMYACGGDLPRDQLQYQQHYADTVLHHGEDSREAAQALLYLGAIYLAGFRLEEAEASARRALTIYESRAGKSSPEAGRALVELGSILGQEGQLARATPVLRRAIQLMQTGGSAFGEEILVAKLNLGIVLQRQGDLSEARTLLEYVLSVRARDASAEAALAEVAVSEGGWRTAESLIRSARRSMEQFPGPSLLPLSGVLRIEASVMAHGNDFTCAESNLERAIMILQQELGPGTRIELEFLEDQRRLLHKLHRRSEARALGKRIRAARAKHMPQA